MTIEEYLQKTAQFIGLKDADFSVDVLEKNDKIEIDMAVPEKLASRFVGTGGQNLMALQYLVRLVFREDCREKYIVLDINQHRSKKEKKLVESAIEQAESVRDSGKEVVYRKLNSYERYLVHTAIANHRKLEEVTTYSANAGSGRWLTICLKADAPNPSPEMEENNE